MKRLPMRKIRDALRLQAAGLSKRKIAASLGVGRTTVGEYLERAEGAGLSWPLPDGLCDEALEQRLFPVPRTGRTQTRPQPDWPAIHRELRRPGVTLSLLWEECRAVHPDGYGYSRFCDLYRRWLGRLSPTMRQVHVAGERMFVDYAGATLEVIDGLTGEVREAQLFVAVLGASSYTYAEATWTQSLPDWTGSHCSAFSFFGGVAAQTVCDYVARHIIAIGLSRFAAGERGVGVEVDPSDIRCLGSDLPVRRGDCLLSGSATDLEGDRDDPASPPNDRGHDRTWFGQEDPGGLSAGRVQAGPLLQQEPGRADDT